MFHNLHFRVKDAEVLEEAKQEPPKPNSSWGDEKQSKSVSWADDAPAKKGNSLIYFDSKLHKLLDLHII